MITYITTFAEQRNTSFTNEVIGFSRTTEYYEYNTYSDTFAVNGVHTETSTSSYSVSSTSESEYVTTYLSTYTVSVTTYTTSTASDTFAIGTYVSSYDTYNTAEYGIQTSTYFTAGCDVSYSIEINSYTYSLSVTPYGIVSYSVYETTTHNAPYPHTISIETYSSAAYSTSSTYYTYTTTSSSFSYTIGTVVWTVDTWSAYPYTTLTTTYDTTVSSSSSFINYISSSYTNGIYETYIADTNATSSGSSFLSVFQNGSITSYTSWTTESFATYLTITYVQSYSYFFGYISKEGAGLTTSHYTESHSKSYLNSYIGTRTPTATTGFRSETYSENITTAQSSGYSFSVSDWGGTTSYTTYSSESSSSITSYGGSTASPVSTVAVVTTTNSYVTYSVTTMVTSSTSVNQTSTTYTGTTTLIGGATLNTTRTTATINTIATTTYSVVSSESWSNNGYSSVTNVVPMKTAYVFERTPIERMFTLSLTSSSFVVLSELVSETTIFSAIPNYTINSSNSEISAYMLSGSSITTQSGITETAFVVSEYSYGNPLFTISETNGTASSPVGAYGYPATSITYAKGIYDITSRTMSNSLVGTNVTVQSTVTDSFISENIINGDKRIHPRMTIVANTSSSSTTVFSLLGAIAFTTTSLANP